LETGGRLQPERFERARQLLRDAIAARAFPGACVEVGAPDDVLWREAFGRLTYEADAAPVERGTIYDLASLTKVIATTTIAMRLVDRGALALDDAVARWIPRWRGADREMVTVRDLLAHASGLTAYLPFYRSNLKGRDDFEPEICGLALEYPPRSRSIYSDLGFILLGFILEDAGQGSLATQFLTIASELDLAPLQYNPPAMWRPVTAPTEVDRDWRGRLIVAEVHDENAAALGGVAGHAGLFGTVAAAGRFAQFALAGFAGDRGLAAPATWAAFTRKSDVPGSSRALGWDTMLPTSSCGTRMSPAALGHTGFTGTSLWIDPVKAVYVVLLTNRVHPSRDNNAISGVRPALHDAIMDAL
jgi:CubicO group peptidase (beta-lactamase class C family)